MTFSIVKNVIGDSVLINYTDAYLNNSGLGSPLIKSVNSNLGAGDVTITFNDAAKEITGSGTAFLTDFNAGDIIRIVDSNALDTFSLLTDFIIDSISTDELMIATEKYFGDAGGIPGAVYYTPDNIAVFQDSQGNDKVIIDKDGNIVSVGNASFASGDFIVTTTTLDYIGTATFGDGGTTNYTEISATGDIKPKGSAFLIFEKASGNGIKVDHATPTFGWRDLEGFEFPDPTGGDRPTLSTYSGGEIKENAFGNGDKLRIRYHIPHDYVKGTDVLSHVHWSHNGTAISGNVVFGVTTDYAKGHNQANFGNEKSISITYNTTDISTTPRYRQRIEESVITNDGGSATLIDRGLLEPDGIILVTFEVTTNPTITGGSPNNVFVHRADLHYQSTNIATKDKVGPGFYT